MPKQVVHEVIDICRQYPEIKNVLCGLESAYCERGTVSQDFYELTNHYFHRLQWVDDFKEVQDTILKFAPTVPADKAYDYYDLFREKLAGKVEPTTSGHAIVAVDYAIKVRNLQSPDDLQRAVKEREGQIELASAFIRSGKETL